MTIELEQPLLETAAELFQTLGHAAVMPDVHARYALLRQTLTIAVEQQLRDVTLKLTGPYAKLDYLMKKHGVRQSDRSLSFALNAVRMRLKDTDRQDKDALDKTWRTDLKAVSRFISLMYDTTVPETLERHFPMHEGKYPEGPEPASSPGKDLLRGVIEDWDDTYIYIRSEDNDCVVRVDYTRQDGFVPGDWSYLRKLMVKGEIMHVVRPRQAKSEDAETLVPELLIYAPDFLINVTSVARCFDVVGVSPLWDLLAKITPSESTLPLLMGNFAGQLLDETAYGKECTYKDSIASFFRHNALDFLYCLKSDARSSHDFHQEAQRQKHNIRQLFDLYEQQTNSRFRSDHIMLEPSFFCDMLGLQGRMDFLDMTMASVIEQKAGKCRWKPGVSPQQYAGKQQSHYVQLLLYRALLHYDYNRVDHEQMQAFLLYSRYPDGLDSAPSAPKLLFEALKIRNFLAYYEGWYARGGMRVLETLEPEQVVPGARGVLWEKYKRPQIQTLLDTVRQASSLERAYYFRFLQFVANEQVLARVGNRTKEQSGFASVWASSTEEKREAGNIYTDLKLCINAGDKDEVSEVFLAFGDGVATDTIDCSNFRTGDIVFCYPYRSGQVPDATSVMVFRGHITDIQAAGITLRLRNPQTGRSVFDFFGNCLWAVEHDMMDSAFSAQYRGLQTFLSCPAERRGWILGTRLPEVDRNVVLKGHYGHSEFNQMVLHAMQAKDIYMVIGPPGTGKTSYGMTNILSEELLHPNTCVLLLAYTNRAVDEICSKLVEMQGKTLAEGGDAPGEGGMNRLAEGGTISEKCSLKMPGFVRLGSVDNCDSAYREYLFSERVGRMQNLMQVDKLVAETRIWCGTATAFSAQHSLFRLKRFSLAIVDEASQILEPQLLPLLTAMHADGNPAIGRFVLIGDEKQLPAVVQQTAKESVVKDELLRRAGLRDCRLSFFERMLNLYGYTASGELNEEVCHLLTRQGRMHKAIAEFPNIRFYGGRLAEVPLPHQCEELPDYQGADGGITGLLQRTRVAFVSCKPRDIPDEGDKTNSAEAAVAARLACEAYRQMEADFDPLRSIGIIVPYRNQIATVRRAIAGYGAEPLTRITIDTVERYQGSQRDVIIYCFTAKKRYQLLFLTNNEYVDSRDGAVIDRKLNVAMTRARKHLILIGNADLLQADLTFRRLIRYCREKGSFVRMDTQD